MKTKPLIECTVLAKHVRQRFGVSSWKALLKNECWMFNKRSVILSPRRSKKRVIQRNPKTPEWETY